MIPSENKIKAPKSTMEKFSFILHKFFLLAMEKLGEVFFSGVRGKGEEIEY